MDRLGIGPKPAQVEIRRTAPSPGPVAELAISLGTVAFRADCNRLLHFDLIDRSRVGSGFVLGRCRSLT